MNSRDAAPNRERVRSLGLTVPAIFVGGLVTDRAQRAARVVKEISSHVGGPQTFLGPTLAVPYRVSSNSTSGSHTTGVYVIFPSQAKAALKTTTFE